MLSIVTWKWVTPGYHSTFTAEHVNVLARMVERHYPAPHRVVCVTNEADGIDPHITIVPDREDFAHLPSPHGGKMPSCYRRLLLFHPDAAQWFGERFVSMDLDCVIVLDLRPLFDRPDDFVGWQDACRPRQLCGSMFMLRAGARPHVWNDFDPTLSPGLAKAAGNYGSDQGWLSYCLHEDSRWTAEDGVLNFNFDLQRGPLRDGARIVFFTGIPKPWDATAMRHEWVRQHWMYE